ncbi:MAG TPA: 1-(5-phosphoribosyl)-5-[(5-phosphoribosylamino)methylideneamino]imidazole-4-carboxamide isomerase [Archaeoglobaceae archaeon]|nr:1-(5-phosphoribosyl)-5-[(5-phosphoribosylamino)methylideneamino]imidazole-4-carboxamide isomerase [Archaeoglobaceae archaeon]
MFRVIPAVDLKDGKCVQLRQGNADDTIISLEDPVKIAEMWAEKAKVIHIIDLSGAFDGRLRHEDIIKDIRNRVYCELQVGGGIRDKLAVENLISFGIDRVIVGTMAVEMMSEVKELAEKYPGKIMVAVDSRMDRVVVKGWSEKTEYAPSDLVQMYDGYDVSFLYTNVDVEGLMEGIVLERIQNLVSSTHHRVYVAGGITTKEDVRNIKNTGAAGVVIGSALYAGKLEIDEVIELDED